ncbi:dihydrofolate reductase family protein, partial [Streptomyces bacillaris]|uniref:dihydrofolate reductase family protein n=1 Tax=Streptomyces bacillaris TaxID=68179 RepID=UPI0036DE860D
MFATTGREDAVATARALAEAQSAARGADLDAILMGGGALVGSALAAGLVDTLVLHLSPIVLRAGTPLFTGSQPCRLVQREVVVTSTATHLTYDVE